VPAPAANHAVSPPPSPLPRLPLPGQFLANAEAWALDADTLLWRAVDGGPVDAAGAPWAGVDLTLPQAVTRARLHWLPATGSDAAPGDVDLVLWGGVWLGSAGPDDPPQYSSWDAPCSRNLGGVGAQSGVGKIVAQPNAVWRARLRAPRGAGSTAPPAPAGVVALLAVAYGGAAALAAAAGMWPSAVVAAAVGADAPTPPGHGGGGDGAASDESAGSGALELDDVDVAASLRGLEARTVGAGDEMIEFVPVPVPAPVSAPQPPPPRAWWQGATSWWVAAAGAARADGFQWASACVSVATAVALSGAWAGVGGPCAPVSGPAAVVTTPLAAAALFPALPAAGMCLRSWAAAAADPPSRLRRAEQGRHCGRGVASGWWLVMAVSDGVHVVAGVVLLVWYAARCAPGVVMGALSVQVATACARGLWWLARCVAREQSKRRVEAHAARHRWQLHVGEPHADTRQRLLPSVHMSVDGDRDGPRGATEAVDASLPDAGQTVTGLRWAHVVPRFHVTASSHLEPGGGSLLDASSVVLSAGSSAIAAPHRTLLRAVAGIASDASSTSRASGAT
jgi:hypothetical protein